MYKCCCGEIFTDLYLLVEHVAHASGEHGLDWLEANRQLQHSLKHDPRPFDQIAHELWRRHDDL